MTDIADLTRQRVDYVHLPGGRIRAILTVTLPNGITRTYEAESDAAISGADSTPNVVDSGEEFFFRYVAKGNPLDAAANDRWWLALEPKSRRYYRYAYKAIQKYAPHGLNEAAQYKWWQSLGQQKREDLREKAGEPSGVSIALTGVASATKKIVTSKAFLLAASALATAIPVLGPIVGPAAMAAVATLGTASKLLDAGVAVSKGDVGGAADLVAQAKQLATQHTKTPAAAADLLRIANDKRKAVERVAAGEPAAKPKAPAAAKPKATKTHTDIVNAARAGRVRSNHGGEVSQAALLAAADKGRVFWITT